jgi:hypothetical protein
MATAAFEPSVTWHRIVEGPGERAAVFARDDGGRLYVRPADFRMEMAAALAGATVAHPEKVPVRHFVRLDWMVESYLRDERLKRRWGRIGRLLDRYASGGEPALAPRAAG